MSSSDKVQTESDVDITRDLSKEEATWDSSSLGGVDWDKTSVISDDDDRVVVDYTVNAQLGIAEDIQVCWYQWMLYELEDCIDDFYVKYPEISGPAEPQPRGLRGPYNALCSLVNIAQRHRFPPTAIVRRCRIPPAAIVGGYEELVEAAEDALEFRHRAEHRQKPMEMQYLHAAIYMPRRLKDDFRKQRSEHAYEVIKAGLPDPVDDSEETKEIRDLIFSRRVFPDPEIDLLSIITDDLRRCSFDWAKRKNPTKFPAEANYKAYEPKYWERSWPTFRAQDEATKLAFPDPDGMLLERSFGGATEIRNFFVHRDGPLNMDRKQPGFWSKMRNAVELPLLLGDHEVAFKIDKMVRKHTSSLSVDEVEQEFQADQVQSTVEGLLQSSTRQRIIAERFTSRPSEGQALRERWVTIDVFMRGEEEFQDLQSGHPRTLSPPPPTQAQPLSAEQLEQSARMAEERAHWNAGTLASYLERMERKDTEGADCESRELGAPTAETQQAAPTDSEDGQTKETTADGNSDVLEDVEEGDDEEEDEEVEDIDSYFASSDDPEHAATGSDGNNNVDDTGWGGQPGG